MPKRSSNDSSRRRSREKYGIKRPSITAIVKHVEDKWTLRKAFWSLPPKGSWIMLGTTRYEVLAAGPDERWTGEEHKLLSRLGAKALPVILIKDTEIPKVYPAAKRAR